MQKFFRNMLQNVKHKIGPVILGLIFFRGLSVAWALTDQDCLGCHSSKVIGRSEKTGKTETLYVDVAVLKKSVHRRVFCVKCHTQIVELPHPENRGAVNCQGCHSRESASYLTSVHGKEFARGNRDVPYCSRCHGEHDIAETKAGRSPLSRSRVVTLCAGCHADRIITQKYAELPGPELVKVYENSVHGKGLKERGLTVGDSTLREVPVCTDCHGTHNLLPVDEPDSPTNKKNIAQTCGRCHFKIAEDYRQSIHGQRLAGGVSDCPTCTNCHGEHSIASVTDPESKTFATNIPTTCGVCHAAAPIVEKYGLAPRRLETYQSSFHGVANRYGKKVVANCASCHGVHDIFPASDPRSSVYSGNLVRTCGKCHPGVSGAFASARIHIEPEPESSLGMYIVRKFYTWFISILVIAFILYIFVDYYGYHRRRRSQV